jgi:hypothetical protein
MLERNLRGETRESAPNIPAGSGKLESGGANAAHFGPFFSKLNWKKLI